ncbi:asparagine synthase, putative [Babesia caballi]|uniref:Asparagine synthase, putative n=1 Tax=Babesia caballi TaxID=5871 RepID=A0AAV4M1L0_BABCB|nr:asparagine synthase, putative [Babesia caballi]
MERVGSIRLVVRSSAPLRGLQLVEDRLRECNETGLVDVAGAGVFGETDHRAGAAAYGFADGVVDGDGPSSVFYRESVTVTEADGLTTARFRSDSAEFELSGTEVHHLEDWGILAVYGRADAGWERFLHRGLSCHADIAKALFSLTGAFSVVYVSFLTSTVYVIKDELGLKSLLFSSDGGCITVADLAVPPHKTWHEVPPEFMIAIRSEISVIARPETRLQRLCRQTKVGYQDVTIAEVNRSIEQVRDSITRAVTELCESRTLRDRVTVLFSGGLDSALLAAMVAEHVKGIEFIELINVAFKPEVAPDRITAMCTYEDLVRVYPGVQFRLVLVDVDTEEYVKAEPHLYSRILPNNTHMDLNIAAALHYAVALRGQVLSPKVIDTNEWKQIKGNTSLMKGVTLRVTISKSPVTRETEQEHHVDRETNTEGWRRVVNESKDSVEALDGKGPLVSGESDGAEVLWERLSGVMSENIADNSGPEYVSHSREVLIGSGADELFGGYGRHAVAHNADQVSFPPEANKDIRRLWKRNLGRDDRVVNAQGLTALYPFLHPHVTQALTELKINAATVVNALDCPEWFKALGVHRSLQYERLRNCEFLGHRNRGVAVHVNKWILREIALRMGLSHCVHFKKRAIQFGTRSAKTFNRLRGMSNRVASDKGAAVIRDSDV